MLKTASNPGADSKQKSVQTVTKTEDAILLRASMSATGKSIQVEWLVDWVEIYCSSARFRGHRRLISRYLM
ncbi:hypothetical protein ABKV19_013918 [Rosa sericea]